MEGAEFDWDKGNLDHIAVHKVVSEEVEEALLGDPLEIDFGITEEGEERWSYLGETSSARLLYIVITLRGDKVRVITAFDAEKHDKLFYLKTKAELQDGTKNS